MDKGQAKDKLRQIGQESLMNQFDDLNERKQKSFLQQIASLHLATYQRQQQTLNEELDGFDNITPFTQCARYEDQTTKELGQQLIKDGQVGCILIAGGQGTRLGISGPKGMFPVSVIMKKSLFQIFAEKVAAAEKQVGRSLPFAVMTSPQNHEQTTTFFAENENFGVTPHFFCQDTLPFLDDAGNLVLDKPGHIAVGPNGNGLILKHFVDSGLWETWKKEGVKYINTILVDNPLADPFDPVMVGTLQVTDAEVMVKCIEKCDPDEKVGVLVKKGDAVSVVEYSELPEGEKKAKNVDGTLKYSCGNISLFSFTMDVIKKMAKIELPLHAAKKSIPDTTPEIKGWKFETFIFDLLPYADRVQALLTPREFCFAPLKNRSGSDSLETVQNALQKRDRQQFREMTGKDAPDHPFELSQEFYYPTNELKQAWSEKIFPHIK